jgi:aryl-alcohol dehydrogenase-like predicted oxidoreductase
VTSFATRRIDALDRDVFRLGLACNYGIDGPVFEHALERGMDYVFWTRLRTGKVEGALKSALKARREKVVVATGPSVGWFGGSVRRSAEDALRELGTDYIDVFHLFWLGTTSAWTEGTVEALVKLKEEKKVRAIGISIHDRERAGRMVKDTPLDVFMLRYNAAHPGAERDVFPHLGGSPKKRSIVAYTATSWRKLLKKPREWDGPVMTAADCYRFCLSSPHVDVALTGPSNREQLDANLVAIDKGPLDADEEKWMRAFGAAVHG